MKWSGWDLQFRAPKPREAFRRIWGNAPRNIFDFIILWYAICCILNAIPWTPSRSATGWLGSTSYQRCVIITIDLEVKHVSAAGLSVITRDFQWSRGAFSDHSGLSVINFCNHCQPLKNLVVQLKPDQPYRWLRPWIL